MARIVNVALRDIKANPYRDLKNYPWIERKIEHLMRSMQDVGVWESIHARPAGDKFEMAFGHHRVEAARRLKIKEMPLIVSRLTDEQMIKWMGRENGEDYTSDMLVLLNTWTGAIQYLSSREEGNQQPKPVELARLLGWTRMNVNGSMQIDNSASACASAHALLEGGHLNYDDLRDLNVSNARVLVERLHSRIETIERMTHKPKAQRDESKKHFVKATKETAKAVREGKVAHKDIRGAVDTKAMENAQFVKGKPIPDFEIFGRDLADMLRRMLKDDKANEKLALVAKVLPALTEEDDRGTIRMLQFELGELEQRAATHVKKITPNKVVNLLEKK